MVDSVSSTLGLVHLLFAICYLLFPCFLLGYWLSRGARGRAPSLPMNDWPLWEIFVRSQNGLSHKHVGSLHAADPKMAIENARDVYARRNEGISIWVVRSADLYASDPADKDTFFDPAKNKIYRHPTFYTVPPEVKHL
jgi:ring-1,2-phenylacetyl-CoA epoxidase subunit PaaB